MIHDRPRECSRVGTPEATLGVARVRRAQWDAGPPLAFTLPFLYNTNPHSLYDPWSRVAMPQTLTEKILARAAGRDQVEPGDNIWVNVDILMTHDVCGPGTIGIFKQHFGQDAKVWDREKVVVIPDHYIFTHDKMANRNVDVLREFVREQDLPYYYDVGTDRYKGVCHIALPAEG